MKKIEIKSIYGKSLFTYEAENATIKDAVQLAVKENISLAYADLRSADLSSANLGEADLRSANLSLADLRWAGLSSADLRSADLCGANLGEANLSSANLHGADLCGANLRDAKNKETACLPIFCKWSFSIKGELIQIGCKEKNIKEWDLFFTSDDFFETKRGTDEFKQIEAVYNACKAYLNTLKK